MADIRYIEKETIIELLKKYAITEQDIEEIYSDTPTSLVQYTKKLCNLYLKYLNLGTDNSLKASAALGAEIIFNLRKFIVRKDITLLIGGMDAEGKKLQTIQIPLTDMLKNPNNFSIDNEGLKLSAAIESYNNLIQNVNRQQSAVWKKLLDASELTGSGDFSTDQVDGYVEDSKGKLHRAYRRLNVDRDVYYAYAGDKEEKISKYYKMSGKNNFQFFNNGWLFEHFMTKWKNADTKLRETYIADSDGKHPLSKIIDKTDSVPGHKGGDFRWRGRDYQAKYGNAQIITINSIKEIMGKIIKFLHEYDEGKRRAYHELVETFTSSKNMDLEGTTQQVNDAYDKITKKMVKSLIQREK